MELLFKEGLTQVAYPIKLVYLETPVNLIYPAQSLFVVPKRLFKKAHERNTLKRRMREVYRLHKATFYEAILEKNKKLLIAFIYIGKKQEEYPAIEKAIHKLVQKI